MIIKGETLLVIIKFKERIDFDKLFNNSDIAQPQSKYNNFGSILFMIYTVKGEYLFTIFNFDGTKWRQKVVQTFYLP